MEIKGKYNTFRGIISVVSFGAGEIEEGLAFLDHMSKWNMMPDEGINELNKLITSIVNAEPKAKN